VTGGGAVVVTGAAGAIGAGIVTALAATGAEVVGVDVVESTGVVRLDITDAAAVDAFVGDLLAAHDRIDGLVNNAAVGPLGTVLETDEATFDHIVAVNLKGTFLMSKAVLPSMVRAGRGSIVNIGSGAGHGKANMAVYAASKAAVHALTMSMSRDHFDDHVRVNTVIPGGGGITSGISLSRSGLSPSEYALLPHKGSVAGRVVEPADVGAAVAFIMGEAAGTISGTIIDVGCMAGQAGT
jgi:NAD(P)-dependent dehydrogenase (short-subunit alcohol dehydrogenase family)